MLTTPLLLILVWISKLSAVEDNQHLDGHHWHTVHLKESDFNMKDSQCPKQTFDEQVAEYQKMIVEDPGRMEFVGADPIPLDKIPNETKCKATKPVRRNDYPSYEIKDDLEDDDDESFEFVPDAECREIIHFARLDIDKIREPDLECEALTEWFSLQ